MYPSDSKEYECTSSYHTSARPFLTLAGCLSPLFRIPCTGQERTIALPLDIWNLLSSAKSFQHHQYYGSRFHVSGEAQALLTSSNVTKVLRVDALGDTWVLSAQVVDQVLKMGKKLCSVTKNWELSISIPLTVATQCGLHPQVHVAGPQLVSLGGALWSLCYVLSRYNSQNPLLLHGVPHPHPPPDLVLAEPKCEILQGGQGNQMVSSLLLGSSNRMGISASSASFRENLDSSCPETWDAYQGNS